MSDLEADPGHISETTYPMLSGNQYEVLKDIAGGTQELLKNLCF